VAKFSAKRWNIHSVSHLAVQVDNKTFPSAFCFFIFMILMISDMTPFTVSVHIEDVTTNALMETQIPDHKDPGRVSLNIKAKFIRGSGTAATMEMFATVNLPSPS